MAKITSNEILREQSLEKLTEVYYAQYKHDNRLPELFELIEPEKLYEWLVEQFDNDFSYKEIKELFDYQPDYLQIGEVEYINGVPHFLFDQSSEGLIFKDEEAYQENWDAPCYVPEYAAEDAAVTVNDIEYECAGDKEHCDWFSHNDLLDICHGNKALCDEMFQELNWTYPSTWLEDRDTHDSIDLEHFWSYVEVGNKVWWNDPEQKTCGWCTVVEIKDPKGEWGIDTVVLILPEGYSVGSEAEVPLCELTDYPYLNNIEDNE